MTIPATAPESLRGYAYPLTNPEFLPPERLKPKSSFVIAAIGVIKQISEMKPPRLNLSTLGKLGLAFSLAVALINVNPAVAYSPTMPPEPIKSFSSLSISVSPETPLPQDFDTRTKTTLKDLERVYRTDDKEGLTGLMSAVAMAESNMTSPGVTGEDVGIMQIREEAVQDVVRDMVTVSGKEAAEKFFDKYGVGLEITKEDLVKNPALAEVLAKAYVLHCQNYASQLTGVRDQNRLYELTTLCYNAGTGNFKNLVKYAQDNKAEMSPSGILKMAFNNASKFAENYKYYPKVTIGVREEKTQQWLFRLIKNQERYRIFLHGQK